MGSNLEFLSRWEKAKSSQIYSTQIDSLSTYTRNMVIDITLWCNLWQTTYASETGELFLSPRNRLGPTYPYIWDFISVLVDKISAWIGNKGKRNKEAGFWVSSNLERKDCDMARNFPRQFSPAIFPGNSPEWLKENPNKKKRKRQRREGCKGTRGVS